MGLAGVPSGEKLGNATPRTARIVTLRPADRNGRVPSEEECCGLLRCIALDRDRAAFAELFGHFAPRVKGFLMRYGLPDVLSEDLAQETMLTVWRKADRFDPARAGVSTWIFTIARNKRIDRLRRDRGGGATARLDVSDEMEDCGSSEEFAIAAQTAEQVRTAIAALPDNQAQIVRLSFFAEKPHAQIAQELGIPLGTVKSRARLALARLRGLLEGQV
jgi:RNA polymerase sigma-70 factor, ECF subfamily